MIALGCSATKMASSTRPHRDHAHWTPWTVDEADVLRQVVVDAMPVDRVGMAAADLHHVVPTVRFAKGGDLGGQGSGPLRIAELINEAHRLPRSRTPSER
jgi:hypothetical protein